MSGNTPVYDKDLEHLKLLSIFHYIVGGLSCLFSSFFIIHVIIGFVMFVGGGFPGQTPQPPPAIFGLLFMFMGAMAVLIGWGIGLTIIYSGLKLKRLENRTFSLVVACISCCFFPFGTVLGVFTLIVICRESVIQRYHENKTMPQSQI